MASGSTGASSNWPRVSSGGIGASFLDFGALESSSSLMVARFSPGRRF